MLVKAHGSPTKTSRTDSVVVYDNRLPNIMVVLSADHPWGPQVRFMIAAGKLPSDVPPDFGYVTDAAQKTAQGRLTKLVPNAKHVIHTNSGHEIHKEQPGLVLDAIREVVEKVRSR